MLRCELLGTMGRGDLQQRYGETHIEYDSKWYWCNGFDSDGEGNTVIFLQDKTKRRSEPIFDWRLLNTERLPSRWYWHTNNVNAFFLSYLPARQWRRGYARTNCRLGGSVGALGFTAELGEYFTQQVQETKFSPLISADDISKKLAAGSDLLLDHNFALLSNNSLMFKENALGSWDSDFGKLFMNNDVWEDELKELGLFKYLGTKEEAKEHKVRYYTKAYKAPKPIDWEGAWAQNVPALDPLVGNQVRQRAEVDLEEEEEEEEVHDRNWALNHVNMGAIFRAGPNPEDGVRRLQEQNRQIRNLMAGRGWNDNG